MLPSQLLGGRATSLRGALRPLLDLNPAFDSRPDSAASHCRAIVSSDAPIVSLIDEISANVTTLLDALHAVRAVFPEHGVPDPLVRSLTLTLNHLNKQPRLHLRLKREQVLGEEETAIRTHILRQMQYPHSRTAELQLAFETRPAAATLHALVVERHRLARAMAFDSYASMVSQLGNCIFAEPDIGAAALPSVAPDRLPSAGPDRPPTVALDRLPTVAPDRLPSVAPGMPISMEELLGVFSGWMSAWGLQVECSSVGRGLRLAFYQGGVLVGQSVLRLQRADAPFFKTHTINTRHGSRNLIFPRVAITGVACPVLSAEQLASRQPIPLADALSIMHELGHVVHVTLSETRYHYCSGTRMLLADFAEMPALFAEKTLLDHVGAKLGYRREDAFIARCDLQLHGRFVPSELAVFESFLRDVVSEANVACRSRFPVEFLLGCTHLGPYGALYYSYPLWRQKLASPKAMDTAELPLLLKRGGLLTREEVLGKLK